ncbi:hypothetical protein KFL_000980250 [Klebsormidium nitens]|uniref:Uncharacterized protein n=1 Tax=Klebsormidium nitens TaxID=105231 RepID=A0A0U9HSN5_KLENI|nr:hypothetical protein KFL_000980250 [Klebsormidium nitens]|eukprot:GAQ82038.1 hypothetical protein KFL_000980250 [Klebsormidium nitens]
MSSAVRLQSRPVSRFSTGLSLPYGVRPSINSAFEASGRLGTFVSRKLPTASCAASIFAKSHLSVSSDSHTFRGLSSSRQSLLKRSSVDKMHRGASTPPTGTLSDSEGYVERNESDFTKEELDDIEAYTIVHVGYDETGLLMWIWICPKNYKKGVPRLRVSRSYGQVVYKDWFTMTIEDNPRTFGDRGNISSGDVLLVKKFIHKNRTVLERFWEQEEDYDWTELLADLQTV